MGSKEILISALSFSVRSSFVAGVWVLMMNSLLKKRVVGPPIQPAR
jgi:hypothetical protein